MPPGDSPLLPKPPPPRPAARDAAIEAALRRFDGVADPPGAAAARSRTAWNRHPQWSLGIAASLVAVIGLPAVFIAFRDQGSNPARVSTPSPAPPQSHQPVAQTAVAPKPSVVPGPVEQRIQLPPGAPPARLQRNETEVPPTDAPAAMTQAAPVTELTYAAPPPPPPPAPPPPPPAAPMIAQKSAEGARDVAVTGSRVRQPNAAPERGESDALNSLPASTALTGGLSREAESVLSPEFRRCFGKDAPLNAESYACLDREYHRLDRLLTSEYSAALARLPNEAARQRLQHDERTWRRTRFRHCKDEVGDLRGSTAAVVNENCEIYALAGRIVRLRHYGR